MKKYIVLALIVSCNHILAQINVDSLRTVWTDTSLPDTSRLNAIHDLAKKGYLYSHPDSSFYYAQLQYNFADSVGAYIQKAEAINTQGVSWAIRGDMNKALENFQSYLTLSEELEYGPGIAGGSFNVGNVYLNIGQKDKALEYYDRSIDENSRLKDKRTLTRILHAKGRILEQEGNLEEAIKVYKEVLAIEKEMKDFNGAAITYVSIGMVYKTLGKHKEAIEILTKGLKVCEKFNDQYGVANALMRIGLVYDIQKEHQKAIEYFERSKLVAEEVGDLKGVANAVQSLGSSYEFKKEYNLALENYDQALILYDTLNDFSNKSICLNNVAKCYLGMGQLEKSRSTANESLNLKKKIGYTKGLPNTLLTLSEVEMALGNMKQAEIHAKQALKISEESQFAENIKDASYILYRLNKIKGNTKLALDNYEVFVATRDSSINEENHRALVKQEYQYNYEKQSLQDSLEFVKKTAIKDAELSKQKTYLISSLIGLLMLIALAYSIFKGKRRSDELLLNILPAETAAELKAKGFAKSRLIDDATVMFTDIKDFTALSEKISAEELVSSMNECFSEYDRIMEKHGVEKIKTIGDSYMAAGGVPTINKDHAVNVINACLEIQEYMNIWQLERKEKNLPHFEIRIGVHSGPIVTGIVGIKKFQYDIWGDTVNTASRIESSGVAGRVNISETTFERVKGKYHLESRGEIEVKGKGKIKMYFVEKAV